MLEPAMEDTPSMYVRGCSVWVKVKEEGTTAATADGTRWLKATVVDVALAQEEGGRSRLLLSAEPDGAQLTVDAAECLLQNTDAAHVQVWLPFHCWRAACPNAPLRKLCARICARCAADKPCSSRPTGGLKGEY